MTEFRRVLFRSLMCRRASERVTFGRPVAARSNIRDWIAESPTGFPVLKHTVLLRLLIGHVAEPERITAMLEAYVDELAEALDDLHRVRESLRGGDAPGQPFHYPSVVADWGLDYFAAETRHTRKALDRLSAATHRSTSGTPSSAEG